MVKNEWKRKYFYKDRSSFSLSEFVRPDLNHEAIKQLISIGYSIEPDTIINDVAKINYQEVDPAPIKFPDSLLSQKPNNCAVYLDGSLTNQVLARLYDSKDTNYIFILPADDSGMRNLYDFISNSKGSFHTIVINTDDYYNIYKKIYQTMDCPVLDKNLVIFYYIFQYMKRNLPKIKYLVLGNGGEENFGNIDYVTLDDDKHYNNLPKKLTQYNLNSLPQNLIDFWDKKDKDASYMRWSMLMDRELKLKNCDIYGITSISSSYGIKCIFPYTHPQVIEYANNLSCESIIKNTIMSDNSWKFNLVTNPELNINCVKDLKECNFFNERIPDKEMILKIWSLSVWLNSKGIKINLKMK